MELSHYTLCYTLTAACFLRDTSTCNLFLLEYNSINLTNWQNKKLFWCEFVNYCIVLQV